MIKKLFFTLLLTALVSCFKKDLNKGLNPLSFSKIFLQLNYQLMMHNNCMIYLKVKTI